MERNGIPTTYHNYKFRSRLEATWACFFDQCGWKWKYEPFDYDGYIPDFALLLPAGNVLAEVKPCLSLKDMKDHTKKIDDSPWNGEALILGVGLLQTESAWNRYLGLIGHYDIGPSRVWEPCAIHFCAEVFSDNPGHTGFHPTDGGWWCRYGGKTCDHKWYISPEEEFDSRWAHAQNMVQWAPKMFGLADAAR